MRYSEIDLQCEDITWFGVDANNHIIAFASGGIGNIPEFVCRSKEEAEELYNYFYDTLAKTTAGHALVAGCNSLISEFVELSSKGLYCFDVETQNSEGEIYMPDNVKAIMQDHVIDADLARSNRIHVPHTY